MVTAASGEFQYFPNAVITPGLNERFERLFKLSEFTENDKHEVQLLSQYSVNKIFSENEATLMDKEKALAIALRRFRIYSYFKYRVYFLQAISQFNSGKKPYQSDPRKLKYQLQMNTDAEHGVLLIDQMLDSDEYERFFPGQTNSLDLPSKQFITLWGNLFNSISRAADEVDKIEKEILVLSDVVREEGPGKLLNNYWLLKSYKETVRNTANCVYDTWEKKIQELRILCISSLDESNKDLSIILAEDCFQAKRKTLFLLGLISDPPAQTNSESQDFKKSNYQQEFSKQSTEFIHRLNLAERVKQCWDSYSNLNASTNYSSDLKAVLGQVRRLNEELVKIPIISKELTLIEQTLTPIENQNLSEIYRFADDLFIPENIKTEKLGNFQDFLTTVSRIDEAIKRQTDFPQQKNVIRRIQSYKQRLSFIVDFLEIEELLSNSGGFDPTEIIKKLNATRTETLLSSKVDEVISKYNLTNLETNDKILAPLFVQVKTLQGNTNTGTSFNIVGGIDLYKRLITFLKKPVTQRSKLLEEIGNLRERLDGEIRRVLSSLDNLPPTSDLDVIKKYLDWYQNEGTDESRFIEYQQCYYELKGLEQVHQKNWSSARAYFQIAEGRPSAKAHKTACTKLAAITESEKGWYKTLHNQALTDELLKKDPDLNIINFGQQLEEILVRFKNPVELLGIADNNLISGLITNFRISLDGQNKDSGDQENPKKDGIDSDDVVAALFHEYWTSKYKGLIDHSIPDSRSFEDKLQQIKKVLEMILSLKKKISPETGMLSIFEGMKQLTRLRQGLNGEEQTLFEECWNSYSIFIKNNFPHGENNPVRIEDTNSTDEQNIKRWILDGMPQDNLLTIYASSISQNFNDRKDQLMTYPNYLVDVTVKDNGAAMLREHKEKLDRLYEKMKECKLILHEYSQIPNGDNKKAETIGSVIGSLTEYIQGVSKARIFLTRVSEAITKLDAALNGSIDLTIPLDSTQPLGIEKIKRQWVTEKEPQEFSTSDKKNQWNNHPGILLFSSKVENYWMLRVNCEIGVQFINGCYVYDIGLNQRENPELKTEGRENPRVLLEKKITALSDSNKVAIDANNGNNRISLELPAIDQNLMQELRCNNPVHLALTCMDYLDSIDKIVEKINKTSWNICIHWGEISGYQDVSDKLKAEQKNIKALIDKLNDLSKLESQRPKLMMTESERNDLKVDESSPYDCDKKCNAGDFGAALICFSHWYPIEGYKDQILYDATFYGRMEYLEQAGEIRTKLDSNPRPSTFVDGTMWAWRHKIEAVDPVPEEVLITNWAKNIYQKIRNKKIQLIDGGDAYRDDCFNAISTWEEKWFKCYSDLSDCDEDRRKHVKRSPLIKWIAKDKWEENLTKINVYYTKYLVEALNVCPENDALKRLNEAWQINSESEGNQ